MEFEDRIVFAPDRGYSNGDDEEDTSWPLEEIEPEDPMRIDSDVPEGDMAATDMGAPVR